MARRARRSTIRRAMKTAPFRLASLLVLAAVAPSLLSAATPSPKERETRQQERIGQGIKSGELTPAEAARLEARAVELRRQIAQTARPTAAN